MPACSSFSSLRKQIDSKGKGTTLRAKLHSLKGSALVKEYMACMRSGKKSKKMRKGRKSRKSRKYRKSRKN